MSKQKIDDEMAAKMLKLLEGGYAIVNIAERFGVRSPAVTRSIRKYREKISGQTTPTV